MQKETPEHEVFASLKKFTKNRPRPTFGLPSAITLGPLNHHGTRVALLYLQTQQAGLLVKPILAKEVGLMSAPVKKFAVGGIQAAVWQNESKEGAQFNTISLDRRYKAKDNEWKSSNSFKMNDLPKAILALQKAYEYLALKSIEENTAPL